MNVMFIVILASYLALGIPFTRSTSEIPDETEIQKKLEFPRNFDNRNIGIVSLLIELILVIEGIDFAKAILQNQTAHYSSCQL